MITDVTIERDGKVLYRLQIPHGDANQKPSGWFCELLDIDHLKSVVERVVSEIDSFAAMDKKEAGSECREAKTEGIEIISRENLSDAIERIFDETFDSILKDLGELRKARTDAIRALVAKAVREAGSDARAVMEEYKARRALANRLVGPVSQINGILGDCAKSGVEPKIVKIERQSGDGKYYLTIDSFAPGD